MSFGEKQGFSGHLFLMYCNWLFVQVPSSQRNQTIEFSWVLYCLVVFFLLLYINCASIPTEET